MVYSFAGSADSKSSVWVVGADGTSPHSITDIDEDALHPAFSQDDSKVFYAASSFTGHHSPIVRPARHQWDIFSVPIQPGSAVSGAVKTQVSRGSFSELHSLDVAPDFVDPHESRILISTSGYPIGGLFEEFNSVDSTRQKIFQPHIPGEPSPGPSYGEAHFIHDGMDILFLAATDTPSGNYDYNVYSMSDITGSGIKQLTHLKGMMKELRVVPNGKATFVNGGVTYLLDFSTLNLKPL